ncbi:MAG: insulinase family protein, partial [Candidatus Margulisbacteria bacterium]|nr:insulinase family protein [Candidatus Margulisiibacteriota bacterium]
MKTIPSSKKSILKNGLRIISEKIPTVRSVALGILIGAGSGNETTEESGLSHLIEHMAFKGTGKRTAIQLAHALDAVGGKMNAYTTKEYTVYYAMVLDKHIDTAVDVLCDMLQGSLFAPKAIEMEKGVILEEIKMYEDTPDELVHDLFAEKILHGHPIGKPTIGNNETVSSFSRDSIMNYRQKWYSPQNTIVSLAGAIPPRISEKIKSYLGSWKGKENVPRPTSPEIKGSINLRRKKTEQVHLCLGVKGVSQVDEDRYPYAVLDNILGGSMGSRLFQEVREKRGLVYSIYSTSSPFRNFGISYVYAGTSEKNLAEVIELILKQFRQIKTAGVSPEELERAKEYLKGTLVLGLESTSARMNWLAKSEFYYGRTMTI